MDRFDSRDFIILIKNFINISLNKTFRCIAIGFFAETQQATFIDNRINYII